MTSSNKLTVTLLLCALLISGGLTYLGYALSGTGVSDEMLEAAIAKYAAKQEAEAQKQQAAANQPRKVTDKNVSDDDAFLGKANAPVTIVEFSEYQCPYCKRHVDQVVPKIREKYIDTGKVKYVFRDFPLGPHLNAMPAALAAECAGDEGNEMYFKMHDEIFKNQASLSKEKLVEIAKSIGLNMKNFNACFDSEKHKDEIAKDIADAKDLGISGTPGFIINGWLVRGAYPFETFETLIEQELK